MDSKIAHEYSHLALPPLGGDYKEPEAWANGYLGERLLVRWVARGAGGGPRALEKAWGGTFSGYPNFERVLIEPALELYRKNGLSRPWLARRDEAGCATSSGSCLRWTTSAARAKPAVFSGGLWRCTRQTRRPVRPSAEGGSMDALTLEAPAKINLTLNVHSRRPDGLTTSPP